MKKCVPALLLTLALFCAMGLSALAAVEDTGFSDVPQDAWYAEAVAYARENGLMSGTAATTFSPNDSTSRAMLVTILHRQVGSPAAQPAGFADVAEGAWYAGAADWAVSAGIVSGYSDGLFAPNDPVTREQLATVLWRMERRPASTGETGFTDQADISAFAVDAVAWAQAGGIIGGTPDNRFEPQRAASRAAVAVVLHRYVTTAEPEPAPLPTPPTSDSNILVSYFSATGGTETIASYIAADLNADIYQILPEVPYTSADLNYNDPNSRSQVELRDSSARPAISGKLEGMEQYDTVLLGYPIWNGQAPKIIRTFLETYDFSDKTIIPFCTSGSSGMGSSGSSLHTLAPAANWMDGTRFVRETAQSAVTSWLSTLDLGTDNDEDAAVTTITVQVGNSTFTATLEENTAVDAFVKMMKSGPVVIQMSDYGGFEKVGSLGTNLPASNSQTTAGFGDIVLYNGNQIVIFYGSNSWSYTRLGKIDDLSGWSDALGRGSVEVTFLIN